MAKPVLSEAEKAQITAAVLEAEQSTSGEIVTLVLRASDDYSGARWRVAVATMMIGSGALAVAIPHLEAVYVLLASIPLLVVGHLMALWPAVLRRAMGKTEIADEVRQKAHESFLDLNVHATRDRTGVLIMVSLLEHRIEVLADTAIHASAPAGYWDQVVAKLSARIRAGDLTGGLVEAVASVGSLLSEKFPIKADDTNELPNAVIVRD